MSSPEFLRRHYGITPDDPVKPRLSTPTNITRRLTGDNGIYEQQSFAVPAKYEKIDPVDEDLEHTNLISVPAPLTAKELAWRKRKATGYKTITTADVLVTPDTKLPIIVE